jgi:hypothetical protein
MYEDSSFSKSAFLISDIDGGIRQSVKGENLLTIVG